MFRRRHNTQQNTKRNSHDRKRCDSASAMLRGPDRKNRVRYDIVAMGLDYVSPDHGVRQAGFVCVCRGPEAAVWSSTIWHDSGLTEKALANSSVHSGFRHCFRPWAVAETWIKRWASLLSWALTFNVGVSPCLGLVLSWPSLVGINKSSLKKHGCSLW